MTSGPSPRLGRGPPPAPGPTGPAKPAPCSLPAPGPVRVCRCRPARLGRSAGPGVGHAGLHPARGRALAGHPALTARRRRPRRDRPHPAARRQHHPPWRPHRYRDSRQETPYRVRTGRGRARHRGGLEGPARCAVPVPGQRVPDTVLVVKADRGAASPSPRRTRSGKGRVPGFRYGLNPPDGAGARWRRAGHDSADNYRRADYDPLCVATLY